MEGGPDYEAMAQDRLKGTVESVASSAREDLTPDDIELAERTKLMMEGGEIKGSDENGLEIKLNKDIVESMGRRYEKYSGILDGRKLDERVAQELWEKYYRVARYNHFAAHAEYAHEHGRHLFKTIYKESENTSEENN